MNAMEFWKERGTPAVVKLCADVGTTYNYYKHIANRRKRPSVDLARAMVAASDGAMTLDELLVPKSELAKVEKKTQQSPEPT